MGWPPAQHPTLCIAVQKYHGPEDASYAKGWRSTVFREGYAPPLARHKTLNYLYYMTAGQHALDTGYDEAIILDAHGKVSETAIGSLLVKTGGRWWRPASPYQLYGTTAIRVSELLMERGDLVAERDLEPHDLAEAEAVWVCNSLMGIMPLCEVEGRPLASPLIEQAAKMRATLFERGKTFR
jgi:branched-subunit amino acid aminotransferase/4-amino-4-deoxychorismate lyase